MAKIYFHSCPFDKNEVTLALESGVDGVIVPREQANLVSSLSRCDVFCEEDIQFISLESKADEESVLKNLREDNKIALAKGWEVIPVENLLAQSDAIIVETENLERARLACGILERGVCGIIVPSEGIGQLKEIVARCRIAKEIENLVPARVTRIQRVGLGHRVCLDTMSLLRRGQGMLVGNSSAFTFLVHAETEHNEYVASRPFRVNAGAVHAYIILPGDKTTYLGELKAGDELLAVNYAGETQLATLGRVKIEIRPMLLIEAEASNEGGQTFGGTVFLQNAETIRLVSPKGEPVSVVALKPGDEVLCRLDQAGRHFGMRVSEEIREH